ncbi:hypothetical protein EDD15DRAFT_2443792 [Pisolithus albus]|nr:hypothetical protein EDD15DRAFT_2443792 [Pisolithus albus]
MNRKGPDTLFEGAAESSLGRHHFSSFIAEGIWFLNDAARPHDESESKHRSRALSTLRASTQRRQQLLITTVPVTSHPIACKTVHMQRTQAPFSIANCAVQAVVLDWVCTKWASAWSVFRDERGPSRFFQAAWFYLALGPNTICYRQVEDNVHMASVTSRLYLCPNLRHPRSRDGNVRYAKPSTHAGINFKVMSDYPASCGDIAHLPDSHTNGHIILLSTVKNKLIVSRPVPDFLHRSGPGPIVFAASPSTRLPSAAEIHASVPSLHVRRRTILHRDVRVGSACIYKPVGHTTHAAHARWTALATRQKSSSGTLMQYRCTIIIGLNYHKKFTAPHYYVVRSPPRQEHHRQREKPVSHHRTNFFRSSSRDCTAHNIQSAEIVIGGVLWTDDQAQLKPEPRCEDIRKCDCSDSVGSDVLLSNLSVGALNVRLSNNGEGQLGDACIPHEGSRAYIIGPWFLTFNKYLHEEPRPIHPQRNDGRVISHYDRRTISTYTCFTYVQLAAFLPDCRHNTCDHVYHLGRIRWAYRYLSGPVDMAADA